MFMFRRELGSVLSFGLTPDAKDLGRKKAHVDGGVHHISRSNAASITDLWNPIKFGRGIGVEGEARLNIDHEGKWTFSGHFQDAGGQSDRIALVFGIKSDKPEAPLLLFEASGVLTVSPEGKRTYNWYKQGSTYDIQDGWHDLARGHSWAAHASYRGPDAIGPAMGSGLFGGTVRDIGGVPQPNTSPGYIDFADLEYDVEMKLKSVGKIDRICA